MITPVVSVIMPTYGHENFIKRAVASLVSQTFTDWELIIISDGASNSTHDIVQTYLKDPRVRYFRNRKNLGLGAAINKGIDNAASDIITYLPSDDIIYKDHLQSLYTTLRNNGAAVLSYSSVRHHYNKSGVIVNDQWLQLVQVMHYKTNNRWTERAELETDDLDRLFWGKIAGEKVHTGTLSCEWVNHPLQRHKIMQEPEGGINTFRSYYQIQTPLRYHSSKGHYTDEENRYSSLRQKAVTSVPESTGLKILLAGELSYNPERVMALSEKGHKLYGLWMEKPYWYNYVGPLPFGHVEDISFSNWEKEIKRIQPDVIYGLLNWQAVPFVHQIIKKNPGIPFVWHFKEGPFICIEKGTWNQLAELYTEADGRVYTSDEMKLWFDSFLEKNINGPDLVLDGDLPKKDWFGQERSGLLSDIDGEFHTVVPGRPIGLHPHNVKELADQKIHLHFYGEFTHGQWKDWIDKTMGMTQGYLHIHPNVNQEDWVKEFSKYDAGWLHFFKSENFGEITRCNWDDLNIPARMATLALAGLPMLQADNHGHIVATQNLVKKMNLGLFFERMHDLGSLLADRQMMTELRNNIWKQRSYFTFDHHADRLIQYFRDVIAGSKAPAIAQKAIA